MPNPVVANDLAKLMVDVFFWPLHVTKAWSAFMRSAPEMLVQPILPNWNLGSIYNITQENSAAPQTEHEIVRKNSYGRQLGRITDALSVLVDKSLNQAALSEGDGKRISDFRKMVSEIQRIRNNEAMKRFNRMADELSHLQMTDPELYAEAVKVLERKLRRT